MVVTILILFILKLILSDEMTLIELALLSGISEWSQIIVI